MSELTAERLRELLDYDRRTGEFRWRVDRGAARCGSIAGRKACLEGRIQIGIFGRCYYASVLAWLYCAGEMPQGVIDHIDGDVTNNAFDNLRVATRSENRRNSRIHRNNIVGLKGVCKHGRSYKAQIRYGGKNFCLGTYRTPEEAHAAYCRRAAQVYGEFFCAGERTPDARDHV